MSGKNQNSEWTLEISPFKGWFDFNLKELWDYRDLILLFVRRDFVAIYKQTILGPLWFFLQPLFTTIIFAIIFSNIAKIPTDGIPPLLFYMSGIIIWTYFSNCVTATSNTFINNAGIFGKVYFPRLIVPISLIITNLLTFAIQFVLYLTFYIYFIIIGTPIYPTIWIVFFPFLLLMMGTLGLGIGIIISSLTTKYRDLSKALGFGIQLWMYVTPIVYPLSQIPYNLQWLFGLNPMTAVIETFRYAFLGNGTIHLWMLVLSLGLTVLILILGIFLFKWVEKTFMDTV